MNAIQKLISDFFCDIYSPKYQFYWNDFLRNIYKICGLFFLFHMVYGWSIKRNLYNWPIFCFSFFRLSLTPSNLRQPTQVRQFCQRKKDRRGLLAYGELLGTFWNKMLIITNLGHEHFITRCNFFKSYGKFWRN